jgi:hypothetical protein
LITTKENIDMDVVNYGAIGFGLVIGWITYRTLRRKEGSSALSDISTVIGAVGGGAVTTQFDSPEIFGLYCIGLTVGFFAYFVVYLGLFGSTATEKIMGD